MGKNLWIEGVKNVGILCLTCSAVYLTTQVDAFSNLSSLLQEEELEVVQGTVSETSEVYGMVRPVILVAVREGESGVEQVGVPYDVVMGDVVFAQTTQVLKEALGNLGEMEWISQEEFMGAVTGAPCLYYELFGSLGLDYLGQWLSLSGGEFREGREVTRFVLGEYGEGIGLYCEGGGLYFVYPVSVVDSSRLEGILGEMEGEELVFAFQEEGYGALHPLMVYGGEPEASVVYRGSSPFEQEDQVERFLGILDYQSTSNGQYGTNDGIVVRGSGDSLRLSYDGRVVYQLEEGSRFQVSRGGEQITLVEQVEGCGQLLLRMLSGLVKVPEVTLYSVEESGGECVVSFYYSLDGVPLVWGDDMVGAEFHLVGENIVGFTVQYRNYVGTEQKNPTLPLRQAQAVLAGRGGVSGEVFFGYQDLGGEVVSAGWIVG